MSLEPRNRAELEKLTMLSKAMFQSQGWDIDHLSNSSNFIAKKTPLAVFVSCHDSEGRKFFSTYDTLDALSKKARRIKIERHLPTIFVFATHLPDVEPELAAKRGTVLLTSDELHLVIALERFTTKLPGLLTDREAAIMGGQLSLCLSIADRFRRSGDLPSAVDWARRAVTGAERYTKAHERLFDLLVEAEDLEAAAALGKTVLQRDPDNLFFLRGMRTLSARAKLGAQGDEWAERIAHAQRKTASAVQQTESFEAILKRQAAKAPHRVDPAHAGTVAPAAADDRGIAGLAKRLFSRRS